MKCIGIIRDEDFGDVSSRYYKTRNRRGARGIIIDNNGKIALFNKVKKNEFKLPGGGIDDDDEDPRQAFLREVKEETGCDVEIIDFLGYIEERRSQDNFKQISYVYIAKVIKNTYKLKLTSKEKDEGGKVIWVKPIEGLELVKKCINNLQASKHENLYHSKFIVTRDLKILEFYLSQTEK